MKGLVFLGGLIQIILGVSLLFFNKALSNWNFTPGGFEDRLMPLNRRQRIIILGLVFLGMGVVMLYD